MAKIEKVILTNMCLIYDDLGNILVQQRNKKTWPGISFPGGHVEKKESFVDSTIREIKEETNLDIWDLKLCGLAQWTNLMGARYIAILFKTNCYSGDIKNSEEGKVFWIKKSELKNYELSPDLWEIFQVIDQDTLNEFFSLRDENEVELLRDYK